jgi:hypothetical protein
MQTIAMLDVQNPEIKLDHKPQITFCYTGTDFLQRTGEKNLLHR